MPESFPLAIKPGWSCWTGCEPHPSRFVPPSLASQDFWSRAWAGRLGCAPTPRLDDVRAAVADFVERYNQSWRLEKLGYQTPLEAREAYELRPAA